jgi:lipopolysaccharide transport system ATP-binding protein
VRLAFAVAAHLDPEILIVDEVLAVGDAAFQKKCIGKMGEVNKQGKTVLFVSHNMAMLSNLCQTGILLIDGRVAKAKSAVAETVEEYISRTFLLSQAGLAERKDRGGEGKIQVRDVRILASDGSERESHPSGQATIIEIHYECLTKHDLDGLDFGISIYHSKNGFVTHLSNALSSQFYDGVKQSGSVRCFLSKLPLTEGTYFLNVIIKQQGIVQDWVQEAKVMHVLGGDYYGTGRSIPKSHGGVMVDQSWLWTNRSG